MKPLFSRRRFLSRSTAGATAIGLSELPFLPSLSRLNAEDLTLPTESVTFRPEIEPLVRLVEDTSRDQLLERVGDRIKAGTSYRDVLSALLLAGVRNIQPRPVGFKFHAVLVVNSAHLASMNSPHNERWLPIFWALDYFKDSQARDQQEGDWSLRRIDNKQIPTAERAAGAFREAMENWDEEAVDLATAGLARSAGATEILNLFARYGCRDYRDIGHKAIYVANSWRTLQSIGWQHAEPVLRSLAYALLAHGGENPSRSNQSADRAGRINQERLNQFRRGWQGGSRDSQATLDLAQSFRVGSDLEASTHALNLVNAGIDPSSLWDGIFNFACELLRRHPGLVSLHAITTANALHFAYQNCGNESTRKQLLLQACAFMPLFRGDTVKQNEDRFDQTSAEPVSTNETEAIDEIFSGMTRKNKAQSAARVFHYLESGHSPRRFIDTARRFLFLKGSNSHDYKFSSAVMEDFYSVSPEWRNHYLAASVFRLRGPSAPTNQIVERINAALT